MKLRLRLLLALAFALVVLVGILTLHTRPAPILTVMTWPGAYGRAQASAQMHPYAAEKNVDVRLSLWDGELAQVAAMVQQHQFKADVIDFELPMAVKACAQGLLEKIDPTLLPPGADNKPAARDFVAGAIGPCWVGSMVYSQLMVFSPTLKQRLKRVPETLADFFDRKKFPGPRALNRSAAKFNLEMALLADGVAPGDVYRNLETPQGLDRAFAKLTALNPIWAHDSADALQWVKNGRAVMATALNGDIQAHFIPGVIWDHQLYEMDVFAIPAGDPEKTRALNFIAYATASAPLAAAADWVAFGPARRSAIALVKNNPETGLPMRALLPTTPENFRNAFAVDDGWWLAHGASLEPRWREFVSR
jgi:putative spermidine/putrescine transport system substrate-binding protein